ncbi:MAG: hypothetical protein ABEJ83_05790 [Candidatus Nanohaloarchaea archaeon]
MGLKAYLADKITRGYVWFARGGVVEIEEYTVEGETRRVYWFDDDSTSMLGQCSPVNTITMNKTSEKYSEKFRDYIFLHELGHTSMNTLFQIVFTPLLIGSMIAALFSLVYPLLWFFWAYVATEALVYSLLLSVLAFLVVTFPMVLIFSSLSFIDEGYAEIYALRRIGKESYLECQEERKEKSETGKITKLSRKFRYPPTWLVIKVDNHLKKLRNLF